MKKVIATILMGGAVAASLLGAGTAEAQVCRDSHGRFAKCWHVDLPSVNLPNNLPSVDLPSVSVPAPAAESPPASSSAPVPGTACSPEGASVATPDGGALICIESVWTVPPANY